MKFISRWRGKKTNPIQTQFKPNLERAFFMRRKHILHRLRRFRGILIDHSQLNTYAAHTMKTGCEISAHSPRNSILERHYKLRRLRR